MVCLFYRNRQKLVVIDIDVRASKKEMIRYISIIFHISPSQSIEHCALPQITDKLGFNTILHQGFRTEVL